MFCNPEPLLSTKTNSALSSGHGGLCPSILVFGSNKHQLLLGASCDFPLCVSLIDADVFSLCLRGVLSFFWFIE